MIRLMIILAMMVGCVYSWYSGQFIIGLTFLIFYIVGMITVYTTFKSKICLIIYGSFFIAYGLLLIVTQYIFIDGTDQGYFVHSDAAFSFFDFAVIQIGPSSWNNFIQSTMMASIYGDYPLFALWINMWKLIGLDWNVSINNLRLFLRIQDLLFAPGVLAILAKYFKEIGFSYKVIINYIIIFGIFSYLFLTSVVFTRDLHVAFFYTCAAYLCLSPNNHRCIYVKFLIIILICSGLRPQNGMFAIVFPLLYYLKNTKPSEKLFFTALIFIALIVATGVLDSFLETHDNYTESLESKNQGGLYSKFNALPFPLNFIFNAVYTLLIPLPVTQNLLDDHIQWVGIPSIAMPFINFIIILSIYKYIKKHNGNYRIIYFFLVCLLYILMSSNVEPSIRRTFAVIPALYMLFGYARLHISSHTYHIIIKNVILAIVGLNIPAVLYLLMKR